MTEAVLIMNNYHAQPLPPGVQSYTQYPPNQPPRPSTSAPSYHSDNAVGPHYQFGGFGNHSLPLSSNFVQNTNTQSFYPYAATPLANFAQYPPNLSGQNPYGIQHVSESHSNILADPNLTPKSYGSLSPDGSIHSVVPSPVVHCNSSFHSSQSDGEQTSHLPTQSPVVYMEVQQKMNSGEVNYCQTSEVRTSQQVNAQQGDSLSSMLNGPEEQVPQKLNRKVAEISQHMDSSKHQETGSVDAKIERYDDTMFLVTQDSGLKNLSEESNRLPDNASASPVYASNFIENAQDIETAAQNAVLREQVYIFPFVIVFSFRVSLFLSVCIFFILMEHCCDRISGSCDSKCHKQSKVSTQHNEISKLLTQNCSAANLLFI